MFGELPLQQGQEVDVICRYLSTNFIILSELELMIEQSPYFTEQQFVEFINAIKSGSIQQVQEIMRTTHYSIANTRDIQFKQPSLYYASVHNSDETSEDLMKILIRNGANITFKDQNQQTVLFYVCREGKEKCTEMLMTHGLNLDEVDVYGQTPLFYAVNDNRLGIVRKYATKSRVNHPDTLAGQTPLYYAARKGHLEMTKCLIEKGADVTHVDSSGKTALDFAKKSKFPEVSEYLNSEYKRIKDVNKYSLPSQSIEESLDKRKKKEDSQKNSRQTYKIVFLNDIGEPHDLTEEEVKTMMQEKPELLSYLFHPEDIPAEMLQNSNNESWAKIASKILNHVCKLKGSFWFAEAVDPIKYNITDYFDIITRPMDLGTIRKKLSHNCYANAAEFCEDMSLVWQNCYRYNGIDHDISKCAKELEISFNECRASFGLDKYLAGK